MSSHRGSQRGSWRGRGRGRGVFASQPNSNPTIQAAPPRPLGAAIDSINLRTLLIEVEDPVIQEVEYVASYNWVIGDSPKIIIPGSPPAWTPPVIDTKLKEDSEAVFRDINAARFPTYPLEPALRSVHTMNPSFDFRSLDIIGCGSTLGNLLRFASSRPLIMGRPTKFRFNVDLIGDTVLFTRRGESPTELITDLRGYGHTFPEAYTTWDAGVSNSSSHQRIVKYEFGGLQLLIRSETDGYVREANTKPPRIDDALGAAQQNIASLEEGFNNMLPTATRGPRDSSLQITLSPTASKVAQSQIFDLKTRAGNRIFDMNEILPRLWVSQTPNFLIAYHKFGLFNRPEVKDVREDLASWEKSNGALLGRFHTILTRIVDVVRDSEKKQCEISWDGEGDLCITEMVGDGTRALPAELMRLFEESEAGDNSVASKHQRQ